jgi:hypothetical protein
VKEREEENGKEKKLVERKMKKGNEKGEGEGEGQERRW